MKTIGEQAKELRESKKWSYTRMAAEVSKYSKEPVNRQKITQLEKAGNRQPQYLLALAAAMGTTADVLLAGRFGIGHNRDTGEDVNQHAPHSAAVDMHKYVAAGDLLIPQYEAGGAMGNGLILEDRQPGIIKSWNVDREWLRLNVPLYTAAKNLCIVTGFGPSMRPKYNPGDPLLLDRGVNTVETEGIYFFRVGKHGFIKQLQRIPTEAGLVIRAKSLNKDYDPFDITEKMDFEVFGKVLTVWKSEQV